MKKDMLLQHNYWYSGILQTGLSIVFELSMHISIIWSYFGVLCEYHFVVLLGLVENVRVYGSTTDYRLWSRVIYGVSSKVSKASKFTFFNLNSCKYHGSIQDFCLGGKLGANKDWLISFPAIYYKWCNAFWTLHNYELTRVCILNMIETCKVQTVVKWPMLC